MSKIDRPPNRKVCPGWRRCVRSDTWFGGDDITLLLLCAVCCGEWRCCVSLITVITVKLIKTTIGLILYCCLIEHLKKKKARCTICGGVRLLPGSKTHQEIKTESYQRKSVWTCLVDWTVSADQFQSALSVLRGSFSIQTLTPSVPWHCSLFVWGLKLSLCHLCFLTPAPSPE